MITDYVDDVSHWERWQLKYRYGVLLIFPPDPPLSQVNALRTQYDPQSQLDALRVALEAASCFAGTPPRRHTFSAHMTLAEFISVEQTKSLMHELEAVAPQGSFLCTGVSYAVPDASFRFAERKRLELSR